MYVCIYNRAIYTNTHTYICIYTYVSTYVYLCTPFLFNLPGHSQERQEQKARHQQGERETRARQRSARRLTTNCANSFSPPTLPPPVLSAVTWVISFSRFSTYTVIALKFDWCTKFSSESFSSRSSSRCCISCSPFCSDC